MQDEQYQQTGNKIPITLDELMQAVFYRLEMYDKLIGGNETSNNTYTPYIDPIIYNTQDGRTVEVPKEIQRRAIEEWKLKREIPGNQNNTPNKESNQCDFESGEYIQPPLNEENNIEINNSYIQPVVKKDYKLLFLTVSAFVVLGIILHKRGNLKF